MCERISISAFIYCFRLSGKPSRVSVDRFLLSVISSFVVSDYLQDHHARACIDFCFLLLFWLSFSVIVFAYRVRLSLCLLFPVTVSDYCFWLLFLIIIPGYLVCLLFPVICLLTVSFVLRSFADYRIIIGSSFFSRWSFPMVFRLLAHYLAFYFSFYRYCLSCRLSFPVVVFAGLPFYRFLPFCHFRVLVLGSLFYRS